MDKKFLMNMAAAMPWLMHTSATIMLAATAGFVISAIPVANARAQSSPPALIISNEPLPAELRSKIYSKPSRAPQITSDQISGAAYFSDSPDTVVGRKINDLRNELFTLQNQVSDLSGQVARLEGQGQNVAAEYYANVATIRTQLQSGTTPGNPRLVQKLTIARDNLERLAGNIAAMNDLAVAITNAASVSAFLLESANATYSLSGAVEEDHVRLAQLEDAINNTVIIIDRLLNNINDDISRTTAYVNTERDNLRTMSLAISTGDLFGKSLSNRPFSRAQQASFTPGGAFPPAESGGAPIGRRPLVKIRFNRPNVSYEQPLYMAINEAMERYPGARFELVAVHPSEGNAAEVAIESTRARRNAERVLRSLTQMGLPLDRLDLQCKPCGRSKRSSSVYTLNYRPEDTCLTGKAANV